MRHHICPHDYGVGRAGKPRESRWVRGRWGWKHVFRDRLSYYASYLVHRTSWWKWLGRLLGGRDNVKVMAVGTVWPSRYNRPRTCDFCGGVNPSDAILLAAAGWVLNSAGCGKYYMHPPGFGSHLAWELGGREGPPPAPPDPNCPDPVPPVKLYTAHFSDEELDLFNEALAAVRGLKTFSQPKEAPKTP